MKGIEVNDNVVKSLLEGANWGDFDIEIEAEQEEVNEDKKAPVTETVVHACPVCKSSLSEAISDDNLLESVTAILERFEEVYGGEEDEDEEYIEDDDDEELVDDEDEDEEDEEDEG